MSGFMIREVRAYSTKQRPNPTTMHGPFADRERAMDELRLMARKTERNNNRSNFYVEPLAAREDAR